MQADHTEISGLSRCPYSRESTFSGSIVYLLYYFFKGVVEASLYNVGLVQYI